MLKSRKVKAVAWAFAISLTLMGCSDTKQLWRQSEIEDVAADAAADAVGDMAGSYGVEELEQRVISLEAENRQLRLEVESLRSDVSSLESEFRSHTHF